MDKPLYLQSELFRFLSSHGFDQLIVSPARNSSTSDWFAIDNVSLVLDSGVLPLKGLNNLNDSLVFTTLNCLLPNSPSSLNCYGTTPTLISLNQMMLSYVYPGKTSLQILPKSF